jgi:hypothetical protein
MFRTIPLSSIRRYSLYTQQWCMLYRFVDGLQSGLGWNCSSILILLERCLQTCMTYTIAECTVKISWWLTEELSETCRVSLQNKFEKLVHLVGFIIRKYVTIRGHVNVKFCMKMWQYVSGRQVVYRAYAFDIFLSCRDIDLRTFLIIIRTQARHRPVVVTHFEFIEKK